MGLGSIVVSLFGDGFGVRSAAGRSNAALAVERGFGVGNTTGWSNTERAIGCLAPLLTALEAWPAV